MKGVKDGESEGETKRMIIEKEVSKPSSPWIAGAEIATSRRIILGQKLLFIFF